jgi:hypothetical protein
LNVYTVVLAKLMGREGKGGGTSVSGGGRASCRGAAMLRWVGGAESEEPCERHF